MALPGTDAPRAGGKCQFYGLGSALGLDPANRQVTPLRMRWGGGAAPTSVIDLGPLRDAAQSAARVVHAGPDHTAVRANDPVVADRRDARLEPARHLDRARVQRGEREAAPLVEAERREVVVRRDEPDATHAAALRRGQRRSVYRHLPSVAILRHQSTASRTEQPRDGPVGSVHRRRAVRCRRRRGMAQRSRR